MVVVNFKTYLQGTGEKAVELARISVRVVRETGIRVVVVPQLGDMRACRETGAECWAQHIDGVEPDRHTGFVTVEEVMAAGATGTLLNHSEHRVPPEEIKKTIERIKQFSGFQVGLSAATLEETVQFSSFFPTYIAYEPPELIGSREKSVSTEKPEIVAQAVNAVPVPLLIGAGVHTAEDVRVGVRLRAAGVLVSTGVVLATDPEKELLELTGAFKV